MHGNVDMFTYQVMQPDGDFDTATLTVTVQDYSYDASFITDNAVGLDQDPATGVIVGTDDDDVLIGGDGNDVLTGGAGNDIMVGGDGQDTFKYGLEDLDGGVDQILDFNLGVDGDVLDLSDIFGGQTLNDLQAGGFLDVAQNTAGFLDVHLDLDGNAMTTNDSVHISVTVTGDAGADAVDTMLTHHITTEI
jgi:Ca2+-binding RTX toxin-like protein